ncbi:UNVERIFIED_CONTAM: hypothetical protein K2H54_037372 [Gekko kuhli]
MVLSTESKEGGGWGILLGTSTKPPGCCDTDKEDSKETDGSLLGDPSQTPFGKMENVKWQRPRLTRKALMKCCLVKWILSSAAPQGSGKEKDGCIVWLCWLHFYVLGCCQKAQEQCQERNVATLGLTVEVEVSELPGGNARRFVLGVERL